MIKFCWYIFLILDADLLQTCGEQIRICMDSAKNNVVSMTSSLGSLLAGHSLFQRLFQIDREESENFEMSEQGQHQVGEEKLDD